MPWELQVCRFCGKGYGHKTGLRNHLSQYVGDWRIPADGIHDVLAIQKILRPEDDDSAPEYRCPSRHCRKIIATRQKFTEHVITESHWGGFPSGPLGGPLGSSTYPYEDVDLSRISEWVLPFHEKEVKIFQREGSFPFLRLPLELRLMVYEMALRFSTIRFYSTKEYRPSVRKGKVYLQCNNDHNPLSLLMTSRGIYEEARAVFYSQNNFVFSDMDAIPIFLIGIGQENAMLLRSVRWWSAADDRYKNQLSSIRPYILGIDGQNPTNNDKLNIWNDHSTYVDFLKKIGRMSCIEPLPEPHRFLRWNPNELGRVRRWRYQLLIHFIDQPHDYRDDRRFRETEITYGAAIYELICHVEKSGR